ncbi:MAG: hypothetical protein VX265_17755, partial [Myxococcota bacterium]|nr:hypothetical protein [Myxococcota bacterium]
MIVLLLPIALAASDTPLPAPLPPPDTAPGRNVVPAPDDPPAFGNDVALGYHIGRLSGPWMQGGLTGVITARYDAFARGRA